MTTHSNGSVEAGIVDSGSVEIGPVEIGPWESTVLHPATSDSVSKAQTVVCVHGFMGSPNDWAPIAVRLAGTRCIALRIPPILSDPQPIAPLSPAGIETAADSLASWLIEHHHASAHLCGYSLGARILVAALARHPELTPRSLTLLAGNPGIADTQRPARLLWDLKNAQLLREQGVERFLSGWYQNDVFSSLRDKPDTLRTLIASKTDQPAEQLAQQVVAYSPARMANYWLALPKLETPTLLLAGELDAKYKHVCEHMAYVMPGARFHTILGAGHTLLTEAPDEVAAQLASFLTEHERA